MTVLKWRPSAGLREITGVAMKWRDRLAGYIPMGASAVIFLLVPIVASIVGWNVQTAIYWVTGLVVLHYTYETYRMRKEMVRQNNSRCNRWSWLRLSGFRWQAAKRDSRVVLRNIGRAPALFVRVDDFNVYATWRAAAVSSCEYRPWTVSKAAWRQP